MSKRQDDAGPNDERLRQVPEGLRGRYAEIVATTDRFCESHLNEEYRDLCRDMAMVLCRDGCPVTSGKAAGWAAGIVSSIAWVNFLGDPSQPHHMKADDMARTLGVSPATMMAKAKVIREGLDLRRMDPDWCVTGMLKENPLVWMVQDKQGFIHDLRQAPREVQEEACRRGLIPFLPGEPSPGREGEEDEA
jgi:hypothetical protein